MALNTTSNLQDGDAEGMPTDGDAGLDALASLWQQENGGAPAENSEPQEVEEESADTPTEETDEAEEDEAEVLEADEPEEEVFTVNAGGKELQVSRSELVSGYQRLSDYTRKTQEVAETRKQVEARAAMVEQAEAYALSLLERYDQQEQEPDWVALEASDPIGFQKAQAQWLSAQSKRQAAQAERQSLQQRHQERYQAAMAEKVRTEAQALVEKLAEAKGDRKKVGELAHSAMRHAAETYAFTRDELENTNDHRVVLMAVDAMKYRQLQAAKPGTLKNVTAAPKLAAPGQPRNNAELLARRVGQASRNLAVTGSKDALADLWAATHSGAGARR